MPFCLSELKKTKAKGQHGPTDQVACSQTLYFLFRDRRNRMKTMGNFTLHALSNCQKKKKKTENRTKKKKETSLNRLLIKVPMFTQVAITSD